MGVLHPFHTCLVNPFLIVSGYQLVCEDQICVTYQLYEPLKVLNIFKIVNYIIIRTNKCY
jgi:hypothetical protein